jgi:hypothetical protein
VYHFTAQRNEGRTMVQSHWNRLISLIFCSIFVDDNSWFGKSHDCSEFRIRAIPLARHFKDFTHYLKSRESEVKVLITFYLMFLSPNPAQFVGRSSSGQSGNRPKQSSPTTASSSSSIR